MGSDLEFEGKLLVKHKGLVIIFFALIETLQGTVLGNDSALVRVQMKSTSGDYEHYIKHRGQTVGHIIDPRTGIPVNTLNRYHSVTVIAASATEAEILSKAGFIYGPEQTRERFPGQRFYFY